ncbi:MAG TPA: peptidoglycan editing factor PgeF [Burkholderiales bacterium]|jgi:YfiH family protein|nr:peptidoglycan editing factor PgeF [Burkholderiales bacterium]
MIAPDWKAPAPVRAFVTTRELGDLKDAAVREKLRPLLPAEPAWLRQVHGTRVIDLDADRSREGDAAFTRRRHNVCVVQMADCLPVLFADAAGTVVAAAHAGWRGLAGGVLEATLAAMRIPGDRVLAWLGPAIGPRAYEVGEDVLDAFRGDEAAFLPARPGHWLLDLYAVARRRLGHAGVTQIYGGGICTYSEPQRFFSYRRDRTGARMGAFIWLA